MGIYQNKEEFDTDKEVVTSRQFLKLICVGKMIPDMDLMGNIKNESRRSYFMVSNPYFFNLRRKNRINNVLGLIF